MEEFNLDQTQIGLFFGIAAFVYIFSSLLVPLLPKSVDKKIWILVGLLGSIPAQFVMGPSQILGLPANSLFLIGVGQVILGAFDPFILIYCLPEMYDVIEQKHPELTEK